MLDLLHRNEIYSVIALTMSTQCVCVCVCAYYFEITLHNVFSFLFTVSSFLCHGDITEAVLSTLFQGEILFPSSRNLTRMSDRPNAQVEKLNFHFSQHSALVLN